MLRHMLIYPEAGFPVNRLQPLQSDCPRPAPNDASKLDGIAERT